MPAMPALPALFAVALLLSHSLALGEADKPPVVGTAHPADASYKLIWQDEFSGDKLDRSKWSAEDDTVIGQYGHGNGAPVAGVRTPRQ